MRVGLIVGLAVLMAMMLVIPALGATGQARPGTVQMAQAQAGPGSRAGARMGAGWGDPQQRMQQVMQRLQLTAAEQQAVQAALSQKVAARTALRTQLQALRDAVQGNVTEAQAKAALDKYRASQQEYERKMAAIDKQLAGKLSARSEARLVAAGIIDNGLGGMGRFGGGGRPGGRMGAGAGGFQGGTAPRPGGGQ